MRKTGIFFATILPTLISFGFQFLSIGLLLGVEGLVLIFSGHSDPVNRMFALLHDTEFTMMMSVIFAILNIAVFGAWYYYRYEGNLLPKPKAAFHPALFGGLALIVPAANFATGLIVAFIALLSPSTMRSYEDLMEQSGLTSSMSFLTLLYAVILGPIGEELIFRGVTLRSARRIFPFWAANLMQAVLFGIFHGNLIQGAYAFAVGLLFGLVCEKLGSIYYSIFLHMCFNFFGTVIPNFIGETDSVPAVLLYYGMTVIATVAAIILLLRGTRALRSQTSAGISDQSDRDRFST